MIKFFSEPINQSASFNRPFLPSSKTNRRSVRSRFFFFLFVAFVLGHFQATPQAEALLALVVIRTPEADFLMLLLPGIHWIC